MTRIAVRGQSVVFTCDGDCCTHEFHSGEYDFESANVAMRRAGWVCYHDTEFKHACPACYVDFCDRTGVLPYIKWTYELKMEGRWLLCSRMRGIQLDHNSRIAHRAPSGYRDNYARERSKFLCDGEGRPHERAYRAQMSRWIQY